MKEKAIQGNSKMSGPGVSIILPSLRPFQLAQCLASIERYTVDIDYEVVVVSPFDIDPNPNIVHVKEVSREGVCRAVTAGYERARGEYVILMADDSRATPLWVTNMIAFMRPHDDEIFEGRFQHFQATGVVPEFTVYGKLYTGFFCIRRDKVARIGGLFDCYYRGFWADPDLSLRVWHHGGRVETCPNAWVYSADCPDDVHENSYNKYFVRDQEAFFRRWYHIYAQPGESRSFAACQGRKPIPSSLMPPEECVKLYISLQRQDWGNVKNILNSDNDDVCIFPESLPVLYDYAMQMLLLPGHPKKIHYAVIRWLYQKGYPRSPFDAQLFKKNRLFIQQWDWRADIHTASSVAHSLIDRRGLAAVADIALRAIRFLINCLGRRAVTYIASKAMRLVLIFTLFFVMQIRNGGQRRGLPT